MRKKHFTRKLFIMLFTICILPVSSVMLMNASVAIPSESAKPDIISVTYRFDESEILNWLDAKQFTKNLKVLSLPGEPLALYKVANILLPPYNEVADVSVVGKISGQHIVNDIPCGQPPAIIGEEPTIAGKNANTYNSDELYPNEIYRVGSAKSFHGYNILNVRLYPVQYKPASRLALYYKEMTVQVKLKEGSTMDTLRNLGKGREAVETLVDNPSILSTYDSTLDTADSTLITTETLGTTYEYIIVTTPDLADEFQVLADWKDMFVDGAKVVTVNVDANETEIKNVINDYYTNYNTSYVLLGGDVDVITSHTKTVMETPIAEDYWYANLVGDDDISYYEVYIGRAPVDTEEETENFVNKVITYEQMDKPKANLFHQSRVRSGNIPDSRELTWQCEQYVPADYVDYELFEENGRIETNDWINFWNNDGVMCVHEGHGSPTSYLINYEVPHVPPRGDVWWYDTDVASLNNTFWPVHTSPTCLSGWFGRDDCIAEVYVKDPDNGAIACLFNDNFGWYSADDSTMYSGDFIEMQFKALYQDGWTSIGAMLAHSKHYFIDEANSGPHWEWCFREINLFGDPETPLLTTRTQTVNVVKNSGWETGNNSFWNVSTTQEPKSVVNYGVNQDGAYTGMYSFHVSMETDSVQAQYTTQSLTDSQSLSETMLDTNTKLKYKIYPAYELQGGVTEVPRARWEIVLSFSTGNKLHYCSSLNMEPTENSTDKYVYVSTDLSQWNSFIDKSVLETYIGKFGTPLSGTTITRIATYVTSETYAEGNKFNRVIAKFDSNEDTGGLQCTPRCVKNVDTDRNYTTIQEAINAPETEDGHTISVHGKFYEHVIVNKSLMLIGQDPWVSIIDGNETGNVVTVQASNVSISQFTIRNGTTGIYLEYSNYTSVSGNKASNNSDIGIYLYRCINSSVSGNTASNNINPYGGSGIVIQNDISTMGNLSLNVGDNSVTGNVVSGSEHGIWLLLSNDNLVSGNTVSNNSDKGIYVYRSRYNNITENHVSNNDYAGISLYSSPYNDITENLVANNNVYGIRLYASLDNVIYHNNFVNNTNQASTLGNTNVWNDDYPSGGNYWSEYTNVDQFRGPNQNVTGSDGIWDNPRQIDANNRDRYPLVNPWTPIQPLTVDDDEGLAYFQTIQEAINAAKPGDTIFVYSGTYNENVVINKHNLTLIGENRTTTIIDGDGTDNVVKVQEKRIRISQFTIQNGNYYSGIYLYYSMHTLISNNTLWNNYEGILLYQSWCNDISGNTLSSNIAYGVHAWSYTGAPQAPTGFGGNSIIGNVITNNGDAGIFLREIAYDTLTGNILSDNPVGILSAKAQFTQITENEISNNTDGMSLWYSKYMTVYHNNLINNTNTPQAYLVSSSGISWDDGYPSGGNYWSDYEERYPDAEELDDSGTWDTPYEINSYNQDNYPLLHPWGSIRNVDTDKIYLTIQKAINAPETETSHTIEVKAGTYYGNVVVNKSLTLTGEDPSTTIIDANETGNVIIVQANNVNIEGFTIKNGEYGIYLNECNYSTVSGNWMLYNTRGIYLFKADNNTITENRISNNSYGIYLYQSEDNVIHHNNFIDNNKQRKMIGSANNEWNSTNLVGNYWNDYKGTDTNGDGIGDTNLPHLGVDDYPLMWKWFPGDLMGDTPGSPGDGDVDHFDFGTFAQAYASEMGDPNYNPIADFDYDGDVDTYDFGTFASQYGKSIPY